MNKYGRSIDKTFLSIDKAEERGLIHRDYIAHCLRWSHVADFIRKKKRWLTSNVVDIGPGKELPLAKTLYVNRTPPKTQSALLEAMQEGSVTTSGKTYDLGSPFFVLATQNPIEQEGTYPLPEAQLDRFMFNIMLDYPSYEEEIQIIKNTTSDRSVELKPVITKEEIIAYQNLVRKVPVTDNVVEYAVKLIQKTRPQREMSSEVSNELLEWGAGPRAAQFLILGAKCNALMNGKYSPDIEDVQEIAIPVLRHRIVRNFKAEAEGIEVEDIIKRLF